MPFFDFRQIRRLDADFRADIFTFAISPRFDLRLLRLSLAGFRHFFRHYF
jgi:hypothetical protein